jgi:hypothetical protein
MKKNKLLLIVPDGVGIRNYLYSKVFDNVQDWVIFHNLGTEILDHVKQYKNFTNEITIPDYKESIKEKYLRELICLSRLYYNTNKVDNKTILTNWVWSQKTFIKKIFYRWIQIQSRYYKSYEAILKLELQYQKEIRKNPFYKNIVDILLKEKPNNIICTHQRGLKMATIFAAGHDLGIPTSTFIYSWDNLPKARLALRANKYLVWSDHMKNEMTIYYPEILDENIIVTGTPQFEFYQDKINIIDKKSFFETYDLNENKKIICFSGDDMLTSPDDPKYLQDISEEIVKAGLENECQILFRRCPVDISGRYEEVIKKYPDLIKEVIPKWNFNSDSSWTTIYPIFDDVKLLVSTVFYSDVVINLGSTMALDFAILKKPCVFINYDQAHKINKNWSTKTIYEFQHFRSMPSKESVIWLNDKTEIIDKLINYKLHENQIAMQDWKDTVVADHNKASELIRKTLDI